MILTLTGSQREDLGKGHRFYEPNTVALHPARETHAQTVGPAGLRCLHVEFGADWVEQNPHVSCALRRSAHFQKCELSWVTAGIHREFLHTDDVSQLAIEGAVLRALSEIHRNLSSHERQTAPHWLKRARDLLHERYSETLSLQSIGDSVGVHPVHLAREFRWHFQTTVAGYVRRLRIQSACRAMCEEELPLSEIAMNCGFADQAHFCRVFKQVVGMTPGEFKSRNYSR